MIRNRTVLSLIMVLFATLFLGGCGDQRIVEQMEFMMNVGYDARPNGRMLMIVATPVIKATGQTKTALYGTVVTTPRQGREILNRQAAGRMEGGKIEQLFFGEALARRGIFAYLDIYARDPFNPLLAEPVVVKGTAKEFFHKFAGWQKTPLSPLYFLSLLKQGAAMADIPRTSVSRFLRDYFSPGIDPMLPLIEAIPERARLLGTALFRDDKFVGELDPDQTFYLLALKGRAGPHSLTIPVSPAVTDRVEDRTMVINTGRVKQKSTLRLCPDRPKIDFDLSFSATLMEYQIETITDPAEIRLLERVAAGHIEQKLKQVWLELQKANADPIGLGNMVRARHQTYWRDHDWRLVYPQVQASFKVKVEITNYGVVR